MAEIVLGIGSSHGPLLSTPAEQWDLRAKADRANKSHWYRGKTYDFDALLKELGRQKYSGWLVVEADQDPAKAHPLTHARLGHDCLRPLARRYWTQ